MNELKRAGVTSRATVPTKWCAGMVLRPKKNGKVRIYIGLPALNRNVCRARYIFLTIDGSQTKLSENKVFARLDANFGFGHVPMRTESCHLTTFITPGGRFCFNRLPFGVSSAAKHFHKRMSTILDSNPEVLCNMDDILVYGENQTVRDRRLIRVTKPLPERFVKINKFLHKLNRLRS